ncbi:hypothetical protein PS645_02212 [Pseudomonas fluorescens]|uniref:Pyosin/cloacin translocation domain-containing protein n=1 Tax=Pseudomonas fluorescens TaxID=294 RepID=A0A5E6SMW0_PSEFL|nr:S-type pyocin domain-containing protein [Pseudomonas fluorescens]VVM79923.1 hypothetical protein PS645_02212 [Pseudomonas fluorescens]
MLNQNFTLPATYVGKQPVSGLDSVGGGFSNIPSQGMSVHHMLNNIQIQVFNQIDAVVSLTSSTYMTQSLQLPQTIENELSAVRAETASGSQSPTAAALREIGITSTLIHRKEVELSSTRILANSFYGSNPHDKTMAQFSDRASQIDRNIYNISPIIQSWADAYQAEYSARLLTQSIELLIQKRANLQSQLAIAQAEEQRLSAAREEAQRVAAELVRANEEAEVRAREQARLSALEEARRAAAEQAKIAAEALAQQVAAEQARVDALAELKRLEEQRQAEENAKISTLPLSGFTAATGPLFAGTAGTVGVSAATSLAIRSALQSALSAAISAAVGSAGAVVSGFAALVYPSPLGNSDLYTLSVPLADLSPIADQNLRAGVQSSGPVRLTVGIGSKANRNAIEYFVVALNGTAVPYDVQVQHATYDPARNVYTTQSPDVHSIGMTWTPIVKPGDASTSLPSGQPGVVVYEGAIVTALEGRIDPFPELDLDTLRGFITVFPADSGIPPIYTIFRDRRNEPGVISGFGQTVSGDWVGAASTMDGAPLPTQIADILRGREFSSFNAFRRAFWKAVAADPVLSSQLPRMSKIEMQKGLSLKAPLADQIGKRTKYELHHLKPIGEDGAVYDIDNIRILGPRQHINAHSTKGEQ